MTLDEIKSKIEGGTQPSEAIPLLDELIKDEPRNDEAYLERGLLHWSCGHRANAINDYLAAIEINPESKARLALKTANEILDYYNKDLYNP